MSQELSLKHLISCLTEKDRYKGTQSYLAEVLSLNEQIYPLIDAALSQTILEVKTKPMARLLALRFFKELLMSANFTLIDQIDEKIEEHIITVAQYNKKSKEVNRGSNYFSEILKVKNDGEMQKMSSSYVLLALQIIQFMGKYYVKDEDGQQTRFAQYYTELLKMGITFPENLNFFKKDDEDKFKKNYKKWIDNQLKPKLESNCLNIKAQGLEENPPIIFTQFMPGNCLNIRVEGLENPPPQIFEQPKFPSNCLNIKVEGLECPPQIFEKPKSEQTKLKNILSAVLKQANKIEQVKTQNIQQNKSKVKSVPKSPQLDELKQKNEEKDEKIKILQLMLKKAEQKSVQNETLYKEQGHKIFKLSQEIKIANLQKEKYIKNSDVSSLQCYKILVNPPRNTEDLIQEIDTLKDTLQKVTLNYKVQLGKLQNQCKQLKEQIQKYRKMQKKLTQKQNKAICSRQSYAAPAIDSSFVVIDQPKYGSYQMNEKEMTIIKEHVIGSDRKIALRDCGNTNEKLRNKLSDINQPEVRQASFKRNGQGSRSLKKTQSHHRLTAYDSTSQFRKNNGISDCKLNRTVQVFKPKNEGAKMMTIFPYLDQYFPPLPADCFRFKQHCLSLVQPGLPFFENQWIKATLIKSNSQKCLLRVQNKTITEQKIKVMSAHPSFSIDGQKIKRVCQGGAVEFQIRIGAPDLNMRCPMISVILGNHGISLINSISEKVFHIPLPITLLDFFQIKKSRKSLDCSKTIKFGVNRFILASYLPNLQSCFSSLQKESKLGEILRSGQIEWSNCLLKVEIWEWSRQLRIGVQFRDNCEMSMSLGKVLLQTLMYLLQN